MKVTEDAKRKYMETEIPVELSQRILQEVNKSDKKRRRKMMLRKTGRRGLLSAAAAAVVFTIGLNTSVSFAKAAEELPVIGEIAKVLTFRSYETKTEDLKISVDIPSVDMISEDFKELESSVNSEIYQLCENYAAAAVKRAEEYRQAFLDTGGTEEEWKAHNIEIKVWYEVKTQTEHYLSLAIQGTENWSSAYSKTRYYNFDLKNGKMVMLKDLLGENYAQIVKEQVHKQTIERDIQLFDENLPEIDENTAFYINGDGVPVVVFEKYEIAPGSDGRQEFEIFREKDAENSAQSENKTYVRTEDHEDSAEETVTGGNVAGQEAEKGAKTQAEGASSDDNFSADMEMVAKFAGNIKSVVSQKDLMALADLTSFPIYVSFQDGGKSIESREELIALGADRVFSEELADSVNKADEKKLSPSRAGFILSRESGAPNIVFGLRNGKLAVSAVNY